MSDPLRWIEADWAVAPRVRVVSTLRTGGVSRDPWRSLNLAAHVGDDPASVQTNRQRLRAALRLPGEPLWLSQVHGREVVLHEAPVETPPRADAAVALSPGRVLAVMTADCLPVALATREGDRVAVAHAGWRGLVGGVLGATVCALDVPPARLVAWLGPAIGPAAFEVGPEVRDAFIARWPESAPAFEPNDRGRFQADLYRLARVALAAEGVGAVAGGGWCTHSAPADFFSYRRDGETGRMATLAWIA